MNKALLVLVALLLLGNAVFAYDLNATSGSGDWNAIGGQIVRGSFGGDYMFFALVMLAMFTLFIWQAGIPAGGAIGIGLVLLFALGPMFSGGLFTTLFNLIILATGAMVGLAILHFVRR